MAIADGVGTYSLQVPNGGGGTFLAPPVGCTCVYVILFFLNILIMSKNAVNLSISADEKEGHFFGNRRRGGLLNFGTFSRGGTVWQSWRTKISANPPPKEKMAYLGLRLQIMTNTVFLMIFYG